MHAKFRQLLKDATGASEFVIAANIDIRGFSSFSTRVESPETAIFLKRVYSRIIEDYFSDASFFKPTGDGLLIIVPYSELNLQDVLPDTVQQCIKIVDQFGSFCSDDPMINFDVPDSIGIGLSRGAACRLESNGRILDYSGRSLNLASRLMDFARPRGIVFDNSFGIELLPTPIRKKFEQDHVYIRSLAEEEPVPIWSTKEWTTISAANKQPIRAARWATIVKEWTLRRIRESGSMFRVELETPPLEPENIQVTARFPQVYNGKKVEGQQRIYEITDFEYHLEGGKNRIHLNCVTLAKYLADAKVKTNWLTTVEIRYRRS